MVNAKETGHVLFRMEISMLEMSDSFFFFLFLSFNLTLSVIHSFIFLSTFSKISQWSQNIPNGSGEFTTLAGDVYQGDVRS